MALSESLPPCNLQITGAGASRQLLSTMVTLNSLYDQ